MRAQWLALRFAVILTATLTGCGDLWGGFSRDNPLHCASRTDACQLDEVCNLQTGACDAVPVTDVVILQPGDMSCMASGTLQACWQAYQIPNSQASLRAVWTDGPSDVWVVGDGGLVLRYDGVAWHKVPSGTKSALNAVWGVSATDIWIVGDGATSLHWNGIALKPDTSPGDNSGAKDYCCVFGTAASDIWVAATHMNANQYVLSHFGDGTWTRINPQQTVPSPMVPQALTGAVANGATTIQLIGQSLLVKSDGTQFPAVVATATASKPRGGYISSSLVGFIVGQNGIIERSMNGQLTGYATVSSPTAADLRDVWGAPDGTLVAVGANGTTIAREQLVWRTEFSVTTVALNRVWGTDTANIWAVGDAGTILNRVVQ